MTLTGLSFASYNSNGFGAGKPEYIGKLLADHDFVIIQEHWLLDGQLGRFNMLGSFCAHAISSVDSTTLLQGRGYGGCAILWNKQLNCQITPVELKSNRIAAVKLIIDKLPMLLFSVYMPCDTENDLANMEAYDAVLSEISDVCESQQCSSA